MALNQRITELSCSSTLAENDLLMVSRFVRDEIYSSYRTTTGTFLESFKGKFQKLGPDDVTGIWKFSGPGNGLFVTSANIQSQKSVINKGYATSAFMEKLNALSAEIFGNEEENIDPHIPSGIGELIFSTTLNSLEKVRSIYGDETTWVQIPGRFIMGHNDSSLIGKTSGEKDVKLELKNVPKHEHTLNFSKDDTKNIRVNEMKTFQKSSVVVKGDSAEPSIKDNGSNPDSDKKCKTYCVFPGDRSIKADFVVEHTKGSGDPSHEIAIRGNGYLQENSGGEKAHNNIPPFYSVYIWRRVS